MAKRDFAARQWAQDALLEMMASYIAGLRGVSSAETICQGHYSTAEYLLRIITEDGQVYRLAVSSVEDEDLEEEFDIVFSNQIIERAFEETGCSCLPLRENLRDLESKFDAECRRLSLELAETEQFAGIGILKEKIAETDQSEHPNLDAIAREATPFMSQWLRE